VRRISFILSLLRNDAVMVGSLNDGLKIRLNKLASLKTNHRTVRLGTDRE
jgi:hypothetical protein